MPGRDTHCACLRRCLGRQAWGRCSASDRAEQVTARAWCRGCVRLSSQPRRHRQPHLRAPGSCDANLSVGCSSCISSCLQGPADLQVCVYPVQLFLHSLHFTSNSTCTRPPASGAPSSCPAVLREGARTALQAAVAIVRQHNAQLCLLCRPAGGRRQPSAQPRPGGRPGGRHG